MTFLGELLSIFFAFHGQNVENEDHFSNLVQVLNWGPFRNHCQSPKLYSLSFERNPTTTFQNRSSTPLILFIFFNERSNALKLRISTNSRHLSANLQILPIFFNNMYRLTNAIGLLTGNFRTPVMFRLLACLMLLPPRLQPMGADLESSWPTFDQSETSPWSGDARGANETVREDSSRGPLLTLVHREMLVLASNRLLYIWPNWQLNPMADCFEQFDVRQNLFTGRDPGRQRASFKEKFWTKNHYQLIELRRGLTPPVVHLKCTRTKRARRAQQHLM